MAFASARFVPALALLTAALVLSSAHAQHADAMDRLPVGTLVYGEGGDITALGIGQLGYYLGGVGTNSARAALPADVSVGFVGQPGIAWGIATPSDASNWRLLLPPRGTRSPVGWFANNVLRFSVTTNRCLVTRLYILDYDSTERRLRVTATDASGNSVSMTTGESFYDGAWLTFEQRGTTEFSIEMVAGANTVLSGLTFDVCEEDEATTSAPSRYLVASLERDLVAAADLVTMGQTRTAARADGWDYRTSDATRQLTWSSDNCLRTPNFNDPDESGGCGYVAPPGFVPAAEGGSCVGVHPSTRAWNQVVEYTLQQTFAAPVTVEVRSADMACGGDGQRLKVLHQPPGSNRAIEVFDRMLPCPADFDAGTVRFDVSPAAGHQVVVVVEQRSNTMYDSTSLQVLVFARCTSRCESSFCAEEYQRSCVDGLPERHALGTCGMSTTTPPPPPPAPGTVPRPPSAVAPSQRQSGDAADDEVSVEIIVIVALACVVIVLLTTVLIACLCLRRQQQQQPPPQGAPPAAVPPASGGAVTVAPMPAEAFGQQPVMGAVVVCDGPPTKPSAACHAQCDSQPVQPAVRGEPRVDDWPPAHDLVGSAGDVEVVH